MLPALWWQLAQHILLLPPDHDCAGQHAVQLLLIGGPCSHGMPVSISTWLARCIRPPVGVRRTH